MHLLTAAALPALSAAFVLPAEPYPQAPLGDISRHHHHDDTASWWEEHVPSKDFITSALDDVVGHMSQGLEHAVHAVEDLGEEISAQLQQALSGTDHPVDVIEGGYHDFDELTIYELISLSNYTKKFAALVDEYPSVVKLLNSTQANYTLFVPTDEAFENIPKHHKKPSKEFIENVLLYHVGLGEYTARRILSTHTIPSAYDEKFLGKEPQRLRTSVGLTGVRVNFYSKVVAADIMAKNGVIHAVRNILVPPPMIGRILSLFPAQFSTMLLAMEKTDFVSWIHGQKMSGSTVFAPSNSAFALLGPRTNAFLFNTEKGLKYLKAILKYHIAPNATLYTDAFYDNTHDKEVESSGFMSREHFDLKTLLGDTHVGVDISNVAGFISMRVNGFAGVSITDGVSKNGVIQVIDHVLIPPHRDGSHGDPKELADISVEELAERLEPFME